MRMEGIDGIQNKSNEQRLVGVRARRTQQCG